MSDTVVNILSRLGLLGLAKGATAAPYTATATAWRPSVARAVGWAGTDRRRRAAVALS